jgi:DNA integrity scanning protein DisA with diadenylate cyclase activity
MKLLQHKNGVIISIHVIYKIWEYFTKYFWLLWLYIVIVSFVAKLFETLIWATRPSELLKRVCSWNIFILYFQLYFSYTRGKVFNNYIVSIFHFTLIYYIVVSFIIHCYFVNAKNCRFVKIIFFFFFFWCKIFIK